MEKSIVAWGVYYAPTKEGKLFAGLKHELMACFKHQIDALKYQYELEQSGYLDELRSGYVVFSMQWIPKGWEIHY
jgi:hypothetical protein